MKKFISGISVLAIAIILSNSLSFAQSTAPPYEIFGGVRYRAELDGKFFRINERPLWMHLLRSTVGVRARPTENISLLVQLQDARNFGEENSGSWRGTLDGSAKNFSLRQGFLEWRNFLSDSLSLKLGRMMFATNNERIIGALDWHNVGRSYDGAVLNYANSGWGARLFGFRLGSEELQMTAATRQAPQMLVGFDISLPFQKVWNLYVYRDNNNSLIPLGSAKDQPVLERYTGGTYFANSIGAFEYEAEAAYQAGKIAAPLNSRADISAFMGALYAGLLINSENQFRIGAGLDYYTGDDLNTEKSELFDHLFITVHKFYGGMDYFPQTVTPVGGRRPGLSPSVTNLGLVDPYIRASVNATNDLKLTLNGHYFLSQRQFKTSTINTNDLGVEIDFVTDYKIAKNVALQGGISGFFPGSALKESNPAAGLGTEMSYWAYTMLMVSF